MDLIKISVRHHLIDLVLCGQRIGSKLILESVTLGRPKELSAMGAKQSNDPLLRRYTALFKGFLDGRVRSLDTIPVDTSWCTVFQKKVLDAARKIPWGNWLSYSDLARNAGYPGAVRAAASVMRNNRFPLVIPCHRVIGKGGRIGGFMGSSTGVHVDLKARLLSNEGVVLGPQEAKK